MFINRQWKKDKFKKKITCGVYVTTVHFIIEMMTSIRFCTGESMPIIIWWTCSTPISEVSIITIYLRQRREHSTKYRSTACNLVHGLGQTARGSSGNLCSKKRRILRGG
jgi:hypothetical protein